LGSGTLPGKTFVEGKGFALKLQAHLATVLAFITVNHSLELGFEPVKLPPKYTPCSD